ncbi:hypothetical protein [Blastopirellula marina]|uniref:Glycosyltransferase RgtA/B/C/D-like domain-containing protein n=1 Tax=Blastopirellula marina TaxID=124 RepID=A0A2S8GM00_9BACT|nr:hypothetical protein [Blastopirellula marina]PQO45458.1 hypothetical protein C5Y93_13485 [Blastopirellula marina]
MNRTSAQISVLLSLLIVAVVLGLYRPAIQGNYGAADDFPTFFPVDNHIPEIYRADGRPVLELLLGIVDGSVDQLKDLGRLRGISVIGIGLLCVTIFYATRRLLPRDEYRLAVAVAVGGLPTLIVFAAWATVWSYAWGAMLAVLAGMVTWRGCRLREAGSIFSAVVCWLISSLLLILIFWTYQPLVSWFWLVALIAVLDGRFLRNRFYRRECTWLAATGFVQMGLCFVALKVFILVSGVEPKSRVQLLSDPLAKAMALGRTTVTMVLDQWQVVDVDRKPLMLAIAAVSLLILVAGFVVAWRSAGQKMRAGVGLRLLWLAAIAFCLAMTHVHGLAADVNVKNYRTIGALCVGTTILLAWAMSQLCDAFLSAKQSRRAHQALACGLIVLSLFMARWNLVHYWTSPYAVGYQYLVEELEAKFTPSTRRIHLVRQTVDDGIVTQHAIHSFARPLSEPEWVMPGILVAALRELPDEPDLSTLTLTHSLSADEAPSGEDVVVIDLRELKKFRAGASK